MKNLLYISLLFTLSFSAQATLSQDQERNNVANKQLDQIVVKNKPVQDTAVMSENYKRTLAEYGTASPEVCVEIARGYEMAIESSTYHQNFFLDMMVARCGIYFRGGEKEAQLERLLDADRRAVELHQRLTGMNLD